MGDSTAKPELRREEQAAQHFDAGYRLAQEADYEGAAREFEIAYRTKKSASVLFNLGQAYAASGQPVAAYDALEEYVRLGALDTERERTVRRLMSIVEARIGELSINVEPPGARIEVDGQAVGMAPLARTLRLETGIHALVVRAQDRQTEAVSVNITSGAKTDVSLRLSPRVQPAYLWIHCSIPDVELWLDDERPGRTPFMNPLPVSVGTHSFVFRRPGYVPDAKTVNITAAVAQSVSCEGKIASPLAPADAATLVVGSRAAMANAGASVYVDGRQLSSTEAVLPSGRHAVEVHARNHQPWRREVRLVPQSLLQLSPDLMPTESYREQRIALGDRQRLWSQVALGAGLGFAATAVTLSVVTAEQYGDWRKERDALNRETSASDGLIVRLRANYEDALDIRRLNDATLVSAILGGTSLALEAFLWLTNDTIPEPMSLGARASRDRGELSCLVRF